VTSTDWLVSAGFLAIAAGVIAAIVVAFFLPDDK
jgi:hypothetical protein